MRSADISIVMDFCEDPLFIIEGHRALVRDCNQAALAFIGIMKEDLLKKSIIPYFYLHSGSDMTTLLNGPLLNLFKGADDQEIPVQIMYRVLHPGDEDAVVAMRLKRIGGEGNLLRILHDIAQVFNSSPDPKYAFERMLERIMHVGGIDSGVIYLLNETGKQLDLAAYRGMSRDFLKEVPFFSSTSLPYNLSMEGTARYSFPGKFYGLVADANLKEGLRCVALIPVKHEGKVIATLFFASHKESSIPVKTRMAIESIVLHLGSLIARMQAEKALHESEKRLRAVVEDQTDLICRFTADGTLTFVNNAYCRFFGVTREDLIGRNIAQRLNSQTKEDIWKHLSLLTTESPVQSYEHLVERSRGRKGWILWTCRAIYDSEGKLFEYQAVGRDETERKRMEERLRKNEERLNLAMEATNDGLWDYNLHHKSLYSSARNYYILDHDPSSELRIRKYLNERVHPDDRAKLSSLILSHLPISDEGYEIEFRIILNDGTIRWILNRGKVVSRDSGGDPVRIIGTNSDITRRKIEEEKRIETEEKLRSIIDNSPAIIFLKDLDGRYILINSRHEHMTGVVAPLALGKTDYDFFPREDADFFNSNDMRVIREKKSIEVEDVIQTADGVRTFLAVKFPLCSATGEIYAVGSILTDITERKAAEEELRRAKEEAEIANRAKSAFLANMSHEIRTPLHGIYGMAQLLLGTELTTGQREYLDNIRVSCDNLMTIIDDILDLSRIEADRLELEIGDLNVENLCHQISAMFFYQAEEKGVELRIHTTESVPAWLKADSSRIRQVLTNLISNAIKFTRQGYVEILFDSGNISGSSVVLRVSVTDTGAGIPAGSRSRIFESFSQGDPSTHREYGGSGLGLAITKGLVERMGGTIEVHSEEGKGSTFIFTVLCEIGKDPGETQDKKGVCPSDIPVGLKILVAEDNIINQRFIQEILRSGGHHVTVVGNGRAVIEALEKESFHCVFMDVQMPEMDGIEATRNIREKEKIEGGHIPIVALTAAAFKGDREKFLAAGMDTYLSKPTGMADLYGALHAVTGLPVDTGSRSGAVKKKSGKSGSESTLDRETFLSMLDNASSATYLEIIDLFLSEWHDRLKRLEESFAAGDLRLLEREAHRLKGTAAVFYAMPLVSLLDALKNAVTDDPGQLGGIIEEIGKGMSLLASELVRIREEIETFSEPGGK